MTQIAASTEYGTDMRGNFSGLQEAPQFPLAVQRGDEIGELVIGSAG
jgi:hypothetical protein